MNRDKVVKALTAGRDREVITFISNAWQNIGETIEFCRCIAGLHGSVVVRWSARRLIEGYCVELRKQLCLLELDKFAQVMGYYERCQSRGDDLFDVLLSTTPDEEQTSIRLIERIAEATLVYNGKFMVPEARGVVMGLCRAMATIVASPTANTWTTFLRFAAEGNMEALEVLKLFPFLLEDSIRKQIVLLDMDVNGLSSEAMVANSFSSYLSVELKQFPDPFLVSSSPEVASAITGLLHEHNDKIRIADIRLNHFLSWYRRNESRFVEDQRRLWHEIERDATWGLRPGGADCIKIGVVDLGYGIDYDRIQYFDTGVFGQPEVKVWQNILGRPLSSSFVLGHDIRSEEYKEGGDNHMVMSRAFRHLALIGLNAILTGKQKTGRTIAKVCRVRPDDLGSMRSQEVRQGPRRPHYRWLPEGQQASLEAISRSREVFPSPPPEGKTFVRAVDHDITYMVETAESYAAVRSIEPLFTVAMAQLGYKQPGGITVCP